MTATLEIGKARVSVLGIATVRRGLQELAGTFPTVEEAELRDAAAGVQPESGGEYLEWSFNSVLLRIPGRTILVDTGFGFSTRGERLGTAALLAECGVRPREVDTVVITHGHGDHIGGLTEEGAPAMPGARVLVSRQELEFWMNGEAERRSGAEASSAQRSAFSICRSQIEAIAADQSIAGSGDTTIRALAAPGHTPGHIGIVVESGGESLWLLVDTIHALFQMEHPDWSPRFDLDPALAETTRRHLLSEAARRKVPVHLYHFPFPAVGKVEAHGPAFVFDPIDL